MSPPLDDGCRLTNIRGGGASRDLGLSLDEREPSRDRAGPFALQQWQPTGSTFSFFLV
jgi:hypothetical protein